MRGGRCLSGVLAPCGNVQLRCFLTPKNVVILYYARHLEMIMYQRSRTGHLGFYHCESGSLVFLSNFLPHPRKIGKCSIISFATRKEVQRKDELVERNTAHLPARTNTKTETAPRVAPFKIVVISNQTHTINSTKTH